MAQNPSAGVADSTVGRLLVDHWDGRLRQSPVWATQLGDHRFDDRIDDNSVEGFAQARAWREGLITRAEGIDDAALSEADRTTLALFRELLTYERAVDATCHFEEWAISARDNPLVGWSRLPENHPVHTPDDGRNLVRRYEAIPTHVDNQIAWLKIGIENGRVATRESIRRTLVQLDQALAEPVSAWPLLDPIEQPLDGWSESEAAAFRSALEAAVDQGIAPAYQRYRDFVRDTLLPVARPDDRAGMKWLPDGDLCYQATARSHTTTEKTADEIHALGLQEIERINQDMVTLGEELFGTRDLGEILARLRTDETLYFKTAEEVEQAATQALSDAKEAMPAWFGTLPAADCVVKPIPDYEAPFTTIAYYQQPAPDVGRSGEYYVNTYAPETRPKFEARVLAYHESIPGHHLQIAISLERSELPAFRRYEGFTAFVEGWALYTEVLADEMGLYPERLDHMGKLSFDAWRASRLVVDTGIHAKGWTRGQAETYLLAHTALTPENVTNEIDRYISWPGQALAYKVGQLEILALRDHARARLGDGFDLKAFHDTVLEQGAVSLPILRQQVARWIDAQATNGASAPTTP